MSFVSDISRSSFCRYLYAFYASFPVRKISSVAIINPSRMEQMHRTQESWTSDHSNGGDSSYRCDATLLLRGKPIGCTRAED